MYRNLLSFQVWRTWCRGYCRCACLASRRLQSNQEVTRFHAILRPLVRKTCLQAFARYEHFLLKFNLTTQRANMGKRGNSTHIFHMLPCCHWMLFLALQIKMFRVLYLIWYFIYFYNFVEKRLYIIYFIWFKPNVLQSFRDLLLQLSSLIKWLLQLESKNLVPNIGPNDCNNDLPWRTGCVIGKERVKHNLEASILITIAINWNWNHNYYRVSLKNYKILISSHDELNQVSHNNLT